MKMYSIGQFAKQLGVTTQTLRNWDKTNKLKPEISQDQKTKNCLKTLYKSLPYSVADYRVNVQI
ncbi:transcriptional regulator, MerR family [Heyndrickxia coagulans]|uniref:Transcriptional regulator, MerR family n=2 Tax=Heyndrickxia coagulans TaxID=1398 RepID=A0A133KG02_HEYCO|nr:transcriptional regulator, MerR family [Heyndrickxia coagulans]